MKEPPTSFWCSQCKVSHGGECPSAKRSESVLTTLKFGMVMSVSGEYVTVKMYPGHGMGVGNFVEVRR